MLEQRPRIVYVSYDGAAEPLGRSQIVPYLLGLAKSCDIELVSFEKDETGRHDLAKLLRESGIKWTARRYHRRPRILSTVLDVLFGSLAVHRACRGSAVDVIHVRSYVPALMALLSARPGSRPWRLLFDIRGFWPEERLSSGQWERRSWIYRVIKACESWFFAEADAVVTLTAASVPSLRSWVAATTPIVVIPTCVDVARFHRSTPHPDGRRVVWCGSVGSFYRFDLTPQLVSALGLPLVVLTRGVTDARAQLAGLAADVREVAPDEIAAELREGDIGLSLYRGGISDVARAPTRIAEYLAAGMVVVATQGIGDVDKLLDEERVGVVINDDSPAGLAQAAHDILTLARDPEGSSARAADGAGAFLGR